MPDTTHYMPSERRDSMSVECRAGVHAPDLAAVASHFDRRADQYAEKYRGDQPRHLYEHEKRERARWTCHWVDQFAPQNASGQFLDVGCGDGRLVRGLLAAHASWQGTGVDVSASMIQQAEACSRDLRGGSRVEWLTGTMDQVERTFDVVVSLGVVGYQTDQLAFLSELSSRVRPGGLLIFTFGNAHSMPRRLRTAAQSLRRIFRRRSRDVRFQALARRQVDDHLVSLGLQRTALRWLCFGFGLPRGGAEARFSRWCETRCRDSFWAESLAQVGLVCFRRCGRIPPDRWVIR